MSETQIAAAAVMITCAVMAFAIFAMGVAGKVVGAWINARWTEPALRRTAIRRGEAGRLECEAAAPSGNWLNGLSLAISDVSDAAAAVSMRVLGVAAGRAVGFAIALVRHDDPVVIVELKRTGPESDAFVSLLAHLAGEKHEGVRFRDRVVGSLVMLEVQPAGVAFADLRLLNCKLFFEPDPLPDPPPENLEGEDEEAWETAEIYFLIDLCAAVLTIGEKDDGYRATLLRRLATDGGLSA